MSQPSVYPGRDRLAKPAAYAEAWYPSHMARKSRAPKAPVVATFAPPKVQARPIRRRVATGNPRAWAKDRIKEDKLELEMFTAVKAYVENHRRKLRKKIRREEKDLAEAVLGGCC